MSKPRDIQQFLDSYPHSSSNPDLTSNIKFYRNEIPCRPGTERYEEWVQAHGRDWRHLEWDHGYIQWFFPIREHGVNPRAQPLEVHEIEVMKDDPEVLERLLRSYKMMLAFYGIDFNGGHLKLAENHKERLSNLRSANHNLLRLTRILKHLSEFPALQPHAAPLVLFFTALHSEGLLDFSNSTMRGGSLEGWWSNCFRDVEERKEVRKVVLNRGGYGDGVWGWKAFEAWYEERVKGGKVGFLGKDATPPADRTD
ncbi:hypothetical protein L202_05996 [Cryptococcus amylolentus CBS 6039]|uniref:Opioid growth factor receptor (OGFr) conserved domain-containing protein n=2 Tax=Cryptococcus amylolentus TaxID=104669 RepID=A0A1E3HKS6_9TREE|nr:hypothetical protein L202_05996 [Cryptococcus amylolentus CBS 6039]ODN76051.1 hypothetical protein L202_05996 [Cryptococcus amylolentus CBS 6039]ODN97154.1 hypothetical protein I350_08134 [Cryptococcus amylolentus CBS 6273]